MFSTRTCHSFGHPEVSFVFADAVPVPGLDRWLIGYFENAVAGGARFQAGQTIDLGGTLLRLFDRSPGVLGVRDLADDGSLPEPESAHRGVMRTWRRKEVAASFDLGLEFPSARLSVLVCTDLEASQRALMLKRGAPTHPRDSGWYIGCTAEHHDHDNPANLLATSIASIAVQFPWLDQFLALPQGTDLVVEMDSRVRVPVLWAPDAIEPRPGSYVAALNAAR